VQFHRRDVQNAVFAVAGLTAGLFGQERHRVAFVQQAQLTLRVAGGAWVDVDAAFQQVAVEVRHQRTDVARGVRALRRFILLLAVFDVFLHAERELDVVAFVDGIHVAARREAHFLVGEAEHAQRRVISKGVDAVTGGVHQHGGRTVNHITRCDLGAARLQEVFFGHRRADRRDATVDRENRTDRDVDIDVGRTVQRIHQNDILGIFSSLAVEYHDFIFFFGSDTRNFTTRFQRRFQFFVRVQVQFHLNFALYVGHPAGSQNINQAGLVDVAVDDFGAQFNCRK
jgi:hypothetical protein